MEVFREKRRHKEFLEMYHRLVERDREASVLQTFTPAATTEPSEPGTSMDG